jgi:hypothetical protein
MRKILRAANLVQSINRGHEKAMLCTVCGKCGVHQEIAGYLREQCGMSWIAREHQERLRNRREHRKKGGNSGKHQRTLGYIKKL